MAMAVVTVMGVVMAMHTAPVAAAAIVVAVSIMEVAAMVIAGTFLRVMVKALVVEDGSWWRL